MLKLMLKPMLKVFVSVCLLSSLVWLPSALAQESQTLSKADLQRLWPIWRGKRTTEQVLERYGDLAEEKLKGYFSKAGVGYPPERISLVSLKEEKIMELWAWHEGRWKHIHDYPIQGASGHAGPKLRQGDRQVPEGIYKVLYLNPNSNYHLSMKLNYPNEFDRSQAKKDGRSNLGGDIFIHGTEYSIGCLAIGNEQIQELYVLAAQTGVKNIETLIAPYDLRRHKPIKRHTDPDWVDGLYADLQKRLQTDFPRSPKPKQVAKTEPKAKHPADVLAIH
ncbi:MAG: L,D-transpeptidase family protein [Gammaproteobacteria bacterium]|nr:L,D-transpeptidase family protein [Gammaproteobacteria bacterium]